MATRRIFVSCGQLTQEEKNFGRAISKLIEEQGMIGFFAQEAHEATDLYTYLFKELQRCDAYVAVLQNRGLVQYPGFDPIKRASVWIEQEIAVMFYRCFLLGRAIPMRVYMERGLRREGFITVSIINPIEFDEGREVLKELEDWLKGPTFKEEPVLARRESVFRSRTAGLEEKYWILLELIAAHSPEPGVDASVVQIKKDFESTWPEARTREKYTDTCMSHLESLGLVTITISRPGISRTWIRINKPWWDMIIEELRNRGQRAP